ncbi:MAG: putative DNA-binding domain-containing protein [Hyphomicrobiales bacterium]|nr:putative DNA-binding domain-containing protein [Hyphomicrobiales bacterium]
MTVPLTELQNLFQGGLTGPDEPILRHIPDSAKLDRASLFGVYRNAYTQRLTEILANDYPKLASLLGQDEFRTMAHGYIAACPSHYPNARWFGRALADGFLATDPHYAARPFLAELAALEWALGEAFDAPDDPIVTVEDLMAIPPEHWPGLRLKLHPSVRIVHSRWGAPEIWQAIDRGEEPQARDTAGEPVDALIWRREFKSYYRTLSEAEAWAIEALGGDINFAELCEGLCRWFPPEDASAQASGFLRGWLEAAIITRVD